MGNRSYLLHYRVRAPQIILLIRGNWLSFSFISFLFQTRLLIKNVRLYTCAHNVGYTITSLCVKYNSKTRKIYFLLALNCFDRPSFYYPDLSTTPHYILRESHGRQIFFSRRQPMQTALQYSFKFRNFYFLWITSHSSPTHSFREGSKFKNFYCSGNAI